MLLRGTKVSTLSLFSLEDSLLVLAMRTLRARTLHVVAPMGFADTHQRSAVRETARRTAMRKQNVDSMARPVNRIVPWKSLLSVRVSIAIRIGLPKNLQSDSSTDSAAALQVSINLSDIPCY